MATLIPMTENGRIEWADNFVIWMPQLGADLGFTAGEIAAGVNDARMMRYVIEDARNASAHSKAKTAYKNDILGGVKPGKNSPDSPVYQEITPPADLTTEGVLARLSNVARRAKEHPNYTDAIGEKLMIATPDADNDSDNSTSKPKGAGTAMPGSVNRIDWMKGKFDGVFIDSQRGDETEWTRLDFDMRSPYEDTRPPLVAGRPEERRYRLIYFIDNQMVGVYSDVIVVITIP